MLVGWKREDVNVSPPLKSASEDLPPRGAGGRNLELRAKGSGTSQRPVWPKSGVTATMNR